MEKHMKRTLKNTMETIQFVGGMLLFPFMGFMAVCNAMGLNSLMEVFAMF